MPQAETKILPEWRGLGSQARLHRQLGGGLGLNWLSGYLSLAWLSLNLKTYRA
jgi:hypothetical protein